MVFTKARGLIALDIDGTLTDKIETVHPDVVDYLSDLHNKGWQFIFITGRPLRWGERTVQTLNFPCALAVQNGALILEWPTKHILDRQYLTQNFLPQMEAVCKKYMMNFVVYTGSENEDRCYYCPQHFDPELHAYLLRRATLTEEEWIPLESYADLPFTTFSAFKCFATKEQAHLLSVQIEETLKLHAPPIRDPFSDTYFVIQVTHAHATKGRALQRYATMHNIQGPIIAAGDDCNDMSMLRVADFKIAMTDAPEELRAIADVIAPPASQNGLIIGLQKILDQFES